MLIQVLENPTILVFLQGLLMIVFLGGAWSTLRERETFEGVVYNYRLLPEFAVQPVSYIVPSAEIAVGLGFLLPVTRPYAALGAAFLLAVFNLAIAINLKRGRTEIDCGCFSSVLKQHLSIGLVVRNSVLMVAAVWLAWSATFVSSITPIWFDWFAGSVAAVVVTLIYLINATSSPLSGHTRTTTNS